MKQLTLEDHKPKKHKSPAKFTQEREPLRTTCVICAKPSVVYAGEHFCGSHGADFLKGLMFLRAVGLDFHTNDVLPERGPANERRKPL